MKVAEATATQLTTFENLLDRAFESSILSGKSKCQAFIGSTVQYQYYQLGQPQVLTVSEGEYLAMKLAVAFAEPAKIIYPEAKQAWRGINTNDIRAGEYNIYLPYEQSPNGCHALDFKIYGNGKNPENLRFVGAYSDKTTIFLAYHDVSNRNEISLEAAELVIASVKNALTAKCWQLMVDINLTELQQKTAIALEALAQSGFAADAKTRDCTTSLNRFVPIQMHNLDYWQYAQENFHQYSSSNQIFSVYMDRGTQNLKIAVNRAAVLDSTPEEIFAAAKNLKNFLTTELPRAYISSGRDINYNAHKLGLQPWAGIQGYPSGIEIKPGHINPGEFKARFIGALKAIGIVNDETIGSVKITEREKNKNGALFETGQMLVFMPIPQMQAFLRAYEEPETREILKLHLEGKSATRLLEARGRFTAEREGR